MYNINVKVEENTMKMLLINLMYIGDLIFMTPVIRDLKLHYPEIELSILIDRKYEELLRYNPYISEVISIDKKGADSGLAGYYRVIQDIRKRRFDIVVNLHGNERSTIFTLFSGARYHSGYAPKLLGKFLGSFVDLNRNVHQVEAYRQTLKETMGIRESAGGMEIYTGSEALQHASVMWQEIFKSSPCQVIGLNTGGSWPTKRWGTQQLAKLADMILAEGYGIAFFGGPMDRDDVAAIISKMTIRTNNAPIGVFTERTSLLEYAELVKKCAVLVSGDSGPMHIAVAQRVPVISIFGPSDSVRYRPYGKGVVVKANLKCLGCGRHQCNDHACMKEIQPETILDYVKFYTASCVA
jgi:lipopolysaccharide heptosyltransferase II